ncbi:MAG: insulinase family protein, partial [Blastocatellia bacterium]|nr:insulinase family protein [Blastocatellia bacterium]
FADASDFNFIFVGNIDAKTAKPLLETYLGSLPAKNRTESYKDLGVRPPKGVIEKEIKKGKDPKSIVTMIFANDLADKKDERFIRSLAQGLSIKLIENLREEKGGVYGTSANAGIEKYPHPSASISIRFTCSPDNVQKLVNAAYEEIKKVQENGFSAEDLNKIKEAQRRDLERNQKENFYWVNLLQSVYQDKEDPQELTQANFSKKIEELSSEKLKEIAQKYMKLDNRVIFTMNPEQ